MGGCFKEAQIQGFIMSNGSIPEWLFEFLVGSCQQN
jgi:hypothetical protein